MLLGTLLFRHPSVLDGFPGSIQQMQLVPVSLLQGWIVGNPLFPFEETCRSKVCLAWGHLRKLPPRKSPW